MNRSRVKFSAKGLAVLVASLACVSGWAAKPVNLQKQPLSILNSISVTNLKDLSFRVDFNGTMHMRMQQTYFDLPVWGGDIVIHVPKDLRGMKLSALMHSRQPFMNGIIYQDLNTDLQAPPAYIRSAAQKERAINQAIQVYQKLSGNRNAVSEQQADLMVYVDKQDKAHYAFLVSFLTQNNADKMPVKPTYILDALTFMGYQGWNNIQTDQSDLDNAEAGGFGGNVRIGKLVYDSLTGDLSELDIERDSANQACLLENSDVTVHDRRKNDAVVKFACEKIDDTHNSIYWDADQDAVNGGYSPSNDALYAGKVIKAMYKDWYGVPVLVDSNGNPMMLNMRVHEYMDNAYWDGRQMTFGDGISMFYPLVSLGVAAHEISHGFTQQHSNLAYYAQSGGLNEAFSDMAAQAAEFYSVGKNSWQIGPEIFKAPGQALRYMDDPTKDCKGRKPGNYCSIGDVKDYHNGLDVHYSSGVFNRVFYLMGSADGSNAKKAFDVMVQANTNYWTSTTTFAAAACGVMQAAKDHDFDLDLVTSAMNTVGIDVSNC